MSVPVAPVGADLRLLRAAVFAAVCVALSGIGHVIGSCAGVPLWTLGAGFLVVLAVAVPCAGRERSLPGISIGLALAQLGLHSLFGLGQHSASASAAHSADSLVPRAAKLVCAGGPVHLTPEQARQILVGAGLLPAGGAGAEAPPSAGSAVGASLVETLLPSLPMLLAHLLAALLLGLVLRRGESALFLLLRLPARGLVDSGPLVRLRTALALVRLLVAGLAERSSEATTRTLAGDWRRKNEPSTPLLAHSVVRRGPPVFTLAA
ncbi:hypothetical protein [Streptomyces sp. TP-A0874]|uniref:hypothetical protein n=1 Tax=Streptomyces sp. TP-A0874 TaxID=549819 RepID=UPI000853A8CF|nr:hypothetical protein [Streptomyces sp. TP-A0874]